MAYIRAIAAGNYSDPAIWNGGVVPGAGDTACPGTFRITLDVDTDAVLSVADADLVSAGGTSSATKVGGFNIPAGATRNLPGGMRYDHFVSATRASSTTAPLYMTGGTLTLGPVTGVPANPMSPAALAVVVIAPSAAETATVTTGAINIPRDLAATATSSYVYYVNPVTGATVNFTLGGNITYTGVYTVAPIRAVYTSAVACPYTLTFAAEVPIWGGSGSTITFDWNITTTNQPNQNVFITPTSFITTGGTSVSYGKAVFIQSVHNVAFTNPSGVTIGNTVNNANDYELTINDLRGAMTFAGPLTIQGHGVISVSGAGTVSLPDTLFAATSNATMVNCNISGGLTTGNLTVAYSGAAVGGYSTGVLNVVGNTTLTVNGNVSYAAGNTGFITAILLSSTSSKPAVFNGDIDARNALVSSSSNFALVSVTTSRTGPITVNGNVYGANNGTHPTPVNIAAAVYYSASAQTYQPLTINGDVIAGSRCPGVYIPVAATVQATVTGAVYGGALGATYKTASPGVVAENQPVRVGSLVFGPEGQFPVYGTCLFLNSSNASVTASDASLAAFTLNASTSIVPAATDVRQGVAVGTTTGSLVVPQPSAVLGGYVYDGATVGTLDLAADLTAVKAKTDQLAFTAGNVHALPSNTADTTAIKAKTDQLTFTGAGVVADSSGVATDYTARFNTLDTAVGAANTAVAGVKTKTDQLVFTIHGVVADAGATDYTTRFNALDSAVAAIPTTDYTPRFNAIDADLNAIGSGGGVDFTPVLTAISAVDGKVVTGNSTATAIKAKTDQFTFTAGGVVADVSVSVSQVIDYSTRFNSLDTVTAAIKAKTDQLTFGVSGVNATATVDTAPITTAINSAVSPISTAVNNVSTNLATHDTEIKAQLTTIQNATGAIDLTPITTGMALIDTHVLAIPTTTYTTRFNALDAGFVGTFAALNSIQADTDAIQASLGTVSVDLSPVLSAVAGVQADTDALQVAVGNISVDLSPVTSAVAGVQATANQIKAKTDTISPCDVSNLAGAVTDLTARFDAVTDGPVTLIPQAPAGATTLYGYCLNQNGTPRAGETVTVYVQQASGSAALLHSTPQTLTSGPDGLVSCTVPRGREYVYAVQYGNRTERVTGKDAAQLEMPSMIKRA